MISDDADDRAGRAILKPLRFIIAIIVCLSLAFGANAQVSDSSDSSEYLIKAGFIYNFAKLVEWPPATFAQPEAPIVICILGVDPFGGVLDQVVSNKKISDRPLIVKRLKWGSDLKDCNILFVSSSEAAHTDELMRLVKGLPILTIGETPGFATRGGIINLTLENSKVRFEVNVEAAKQANLNISSRLLTLARIVVAPDGRKPE